jgi:hypothetical protein
MTMPVPQTSVLTSQDFGVPGQLADFQSVSDAVVDMAINTDTVDMPFGTCVKQGTSDDGALMPTSLADLLKGIVVQANDFERLTQLNSDGITPGTPLGLLKRGRVWILPYTDVTPTSEVHVQVVANTDHPVGTIRGTADANKTLDITAFAKWLTTATVASGNPAKLDVDFTNVSLATQDT